MQTLDGLFDFQSYADIVSALERVLGIPAAEVHERLFREALEIGWNVSRAAHAAGVTPHVYDDRMEAFYKQTDAFVFELVAVQCTPYSREVDRRVVKALEAGCPRPSRVLTLGDGIGSDSLRCASLGHQVTYMEFEGLSSSLARFRFQRSGRQDRIAVCHDPAKLPTGAFDAVVCREVLEHVPDPPALVRSIGSYLVPGGLAVISESFGMVAPAFPTHLAQNLKFQGRTDDLFFDAGFGPVTSFPDDKPLVFRKEAEPGRARPRRLRRKRPLQDSVRAMGRRILRLIPF
jgi:SAM-dependent methyltransferase